LPNSSFLKKQQKGNSYPALQKASQNKKGSQEKGQEENCPIFPSWFYPISA